MTSRHVRQTQGSTPGRRTNITGNQYFDVGKVGRKTGITLRDTGIRDNHGLEPMSGIFSTPGSVRESSYFEDDGSADMEGLDSVVPEVDETLRSRKTYRVLDAPPTSSRHTPTGDSPRAWSQPAYGSPEEDRAKGPRLQFRSNGVRHSIEKTSPFKPKHVLRRSVVGEVHRDHRTPQNTASKSALPSAPVTASRQLIRSPGSVPARQQRTSLHHRANESLFVGEDEQIEYQQDDSLQYSTRDEIEGALDLAESLLHNSSPNTSQKRRRLDGSSGINNARHTPEFAQMTVGPSQKRARLSLFMDDQESDMQSETGDYASQIAPTSKRQSGVASTYDHQPLNDEQTLHSRRVSHNERTFHNDQTSHHEQTYNDDQLLDDGQPPKDEQLDDEQLQPLYEQPLDDEQLQPLDEQPLDDEQLQRLDEQPLDDYGYDEQEEYDDEDGASVDLPMAPRSDNEDVEAGSSTAQTRPPKSSTTRKGKSPQKSRVKIAAPPRRQRSATATDSESESDAETNRSKRSGSRSNVQLRAATPFEDADQKTTRSGRPIMKPLDWWAGESIVYKHGEVEGVIRANSVEPERKPTNKKRTAHKRKTKKLKAGLDAIEEGDEDLLPSEWEDELGVLTGDVAQWDPELQTGNDEDVVTEDIAFATSAIITRSVVGATFSYAKIQTLPFFGSGVVELPPDGVKTTKNSRKMQMNFFVHKGKVTVTITSPISEDQSEPVTSSVFNITEGGAWIVPRGNNYMVENMSSNSNAMLFFSQGCEVGAPGQDDSG